MTTKQINMEWMQDLLNENNRGKREMADDLPKVEWLKNGKDYKKKIMFKVLPANSKENNIFAHVVGMHWNMGPDNKWMVCPEQSIHLKKHGIVCPVCEAKRRLLAKGFKNEDLTVQGKYGPMPIFDPKVTTNLKVVVTESDLRSDWDKSHISILQQNYASPARWFVEKYVDNNVPDFLLMESSNQFEFSRPTESSKWERAVSFATFTPEAEVLGSLKEENEGLVLTDMWKMPSDQDLLEMKRIVGDMMVEFDTAKSLASSVASAGAADLDDEIPF